MDDLPFEVDGLREYESPKVLATFAADEVLAEAETSSVVIIVS